MTNIHPTQYSEVRSMSNLVPDQAGVPGASENSERAVTLSPRVDVLETENEFLVLADMPGVAANDVDIRFEKGELVVHGRRPAAREFEATAYHRAFNVADSVDADHITADIKSGVLTIRLPKIEAIKPKRITVNG
jgi:HSP20 family protein